MILDSIKINIDVNPMNKTISSYILGHVTNRTYNVTIYKKQFFTHLFLIFLSNNIY